jgi:hypothetical protein
MNKKEIYICENCGEEFIDLDKCNSHEEKCTNKRLKFRENVQGALNRALSKYNSLIARSSFKTEEETDRYCEGYSSYCFEIKIELSNGNNVRVFEGYDQNLYGYVEEDVIFNSLNKAIEQGLTTIYEGFLLIDTDEYGYRTDKLGEIEVCDIVDRLVGRKVRIEVIE